MSIEPSADKRSSVEQPGAQTSGAQPGKPNLPLERNRFGGTQRRRPALGGC